MNVREIDETLDEQSNSEEYEKALLEDTKIKLQSSSVEIVKYIAEKNSLIESIDKEIQRLKEYKKIQEYRLERFKEYTTTAMQLAEIPRLETSYGSIAIRKNPLSVEVLDIDKIPKEFIKIKTEVSADKKAISDYFKETGEVVDGIKMNTNGYSLTLK